MRRPLALLRPQPGWDASAASVRVAGLEVVGHPLFVSEPVEWQRPEQEFDALLIGSAAVFSHGGAQLAELRELPVYAVGEATADAARDAGFAVARVGMGGIQSLLDAASSNSCRFLRLGGEERVPLHPHPGQSVTECAVYRLCAGPIAPAFARALAHRSPLVALHSAAAARHFGAEIDRLGIERGRLFLLALGPRVAKEAGLGWASLHIADAPSEAALLAKAVALCK